MTPHPPRLPAKRLGAALLPVLLTLLSEPAHALLAECSISTSGVSFGAYDVFSPAPLDGSGAISVSCTGLVASVLVSYELLLSPGGSGGYLSRTLSNGSGQLSYNLYTDSARTSVWGDGSSGTAKVSDGYLLGLFTVTKDYPVYGRIPALQNAAVGGYADTIVVTVNY
jgi:spore coat protein U-like protein